MRFAARFFTPLIAQGQLNLFGLGAIHLFETGVVLQGWQPKFIVPYCSRLFYPLMSEPATLTIPYMKIKQYWRPKLFYHRLRVELPMIAGAQRKPQSLFFRTPGSQLRFAEELEKNLRVVKTFLLEG